MESCVCGRVFNRDTTTELVSTDKQDLLNAAATRLNDVVVSVCMNCLEKCGVSDHDSKTRKLKIIGELNTKYSSQCIHVMCKKCSKLIEEKKSTKPNQKGNYAIHCNICDSDHFMTEKEYKSTFEAKVCECVIF